MSGSRRFSLSLSLRLFRAAALGVAVLWGVVECAALLRSRWVTPLSR